MSGPCRTQLSIISRQVSPCPTLIGVGLLGSPLMGHINPPRWYPCPISTTHGDEEPSRIDLPSGRVPESGLESPSN